MPGCIKIDAPPFGNQPIDVAIRAGAGVGVGSGEGVFEGVGTVEGVVKGVADADAVAFVVVFAVVVAELDAACGALLAAWLLLVDDVQPAIDNEAITTSAMIATTFFTIQGRLLDVLLLKYKTRKTQLLQLISSHFLEVARQRENLSINTLFLQPNGLVPCKVVYVNPITRMMKRYIKMPLKYALPLLFVGALVLASTTGCTDSTNPSPSASSAPTAQPTKVTASPTAKATPTPTAAPTAAKGTASNSKISVAASNRGVYVSDNQFIQPKAGNKYVQIYVTVTNVNYPSETIGNQFYFKLFDSKNEGHSPTTASFGEGGLESISNSNPGQKTAGTLVFEISQSANPVYLTYDDYENDLTITL